jgi:hypothetical protein
VSFPRPARELFAPGAFAGHTVDEFGPELYGRILPEPNPACRTASAMSEFLSWGRYAGIGRGAIIANKKAPGYTTPGASLPRGKLVLR